MVYRMDQLIYLLYIILILLVFPLSILLYREALPRRNVKTKEKVEKIKAKGIAVLIRNGKILELKRNCKLLENGTLIVEKNKLWKLPKTDPYILKKRFGAEQLYIVDANTQAIYEFQDPPEGEKKGKINPVVLDPRTLYNYIASGSIRKLLGKITVSKGEAVLYMFAGMVIIIIMIFFLLPLLGHEVIIR